jgi:Tfp pilus assembly protein PilF
LLRRSSAAPLRRLQNQSAPEGALFSHPQTDEIEAARKARAQNYLAQGKKGMARKDLERILAEDSSYQGVRQQLDELAGER